MSFLLNENMLELSGMEDVDASFHPLTNNVLRYAMAEIILTDLPNSRQVAKNTNSIYYFTGKKCHNGHLEKRNTKSGKCLECDRITSRQFRKDNPEYSSQFNKKYYIKNSEKLIKEAAIYYKENKEHLNKKKKEWNKKNSEFLSLYKKKYREENIELHRQWYSEYYIQNRDYLLLREKERRKENIEIYRARGKNAKARRKKAVGKFTLADIKKLLDVQKNKCAYCKKSVNNNYHVDHIMPISLGGNNSPNNLQITCPTCNLKKNAKHPNDWARELGLLV